MVCLAIRYLQFAQFSTLPHEKTASEGGRGERAVAVASWRANYLHGASVQCAADSPKKRQAVGRVDESFRSSPLSVCLSDLSSLDFVGVPL